MKHLKIWLLTGFLQFFLTEVNAQQKQRIYFYVDTITINPESRLAEIKQAGAEKFCLLLSFSSFFFNTAQAQKKKIYMLVDTVTISSESRLAEIKQAGAEKFYTFFCKCLEPKQDIVFAYLMRQQNKVTKKKPAGNYISWKKLLELIDNKIPQFDQKYELFITERLPGKKYTTNKVLSDWRREVIVY